MRIAFAFLAALLALPVPLEAAAGKLGITAPEQSLGWIKGYRERPAPKAVPGLVRELASVGAFHEPEGAGVYVGFMAGVIGSNPETAEKLIAEMAKVPPADQWAVIKAIAYSRVDDWRGLLARSAKHMPTRSAMIDAYLSGKLAGYDRYRMEEAKPSMLERAKRIVSRRAKTDPELYLEPSPALLDSFWGYYFATGSTEPLADIARLVRWSKDGNDVAKLTMGSSAKYSLAANASRDLKVLGAVKDVRNTLGDDLTPLIDEAIFAAEVSETGKLRDEAADAITIMRTKGPAYLRKVKWWGRAGEGAIALGCVVAAVTGQVYLGVPCVIGGAVTSAGLKYLARQES